MKIKVCLVIFLAASLGLLWQAYRRAHTLQRTLDFQTASIKSLARSHAHAHFSHTNASYFILGLVRRDYVEAFATHFKDYGITPVATGCKVTEPQQAYSDEYDRVIRESLTARHGKDLIREFDREFDTAWSKRTQ